MCDEEHLGGNVNDTPLTPRQEEKSKRLAPKRIIYDDIDNLRATERDSLLPPRQQQSSHAHDSSASDRSSDSDPLYTIPQFQSNSDDIRVFRICLRSLKAFFRRVFTNFRTPLVPVYLAGMVITSGFNSASFYSMTTSMENYSFFVSIVPIFAYILIFFPIVGWRAWRARNDLQNRRVWSAKSMLMLSAIALCDSLANLLVTYGSSGTLPVFLPILIQTVVPVSMFLSFVVLKVRYRWQHYAGVLVVLAAVVLSVTLSPATSSVDDPGENILGFNIMLILASIPSGIGGVVKEQSFKDMEMDINFLCAWESLFQLLVSFLFVPLLAFVPVPGKPRVDSSDIWGSMVTGGFNCMVGVDTLPSDRCQEAPGHVILFVCLDVVFNVFLLLLVKHGSCSLMFTAKAMSVPLTALLFSIPYFGHQQAAAPVTWVSVFMILCGLLLYSSVPEVPRDDGNNTVIAGIGSVSQAMPFQSEVVCIRPRTAQQIRGDGYRKMGYTVHDMIREGYTGPATPDFKDPIPQTESAPPEVL